MVACPVNRFGPHDASRSASFDFQFKRDRHSGLLAFSGARVQVEAYRHSVLYVNLMSVVDSSVLNWVEQQELRRLASEDRLFGK